MTYDDLKLYDGQILDVLARRAPRRRDGDDPRRERRLHRVADRSSSRPPAAPRRKLPRARRGRCWSSARRRIAPSRCARTGRRAGPDRARLGPRGGRADPLGARARPAGSSPRPARSISFSLPTISASTRAIRARKCVCSPPPRDKANQEVIWDGLSDGAFTVFSSDHAPFRYDAPEGKKPGGDEVDVPPHPERHSRARDAPAAAVFARACSADRITINTLRRADRHQSGEGVRTASAQGHDRGRQRCRPRDLGRARARC